MFEATLLGLSKIDFTNGSGERIHGTKLYICYQEQSVTGFKTDAVFVKPEIKLPEDIKLNCKVGISCNLKGKIQSIQVLKS